MKKDQQYMYICKHARAILHWVNWVTYDCQEDTCTCIWYKTWTLDWTVDWTGLGSACIYTILLVLIEKTRHRY